MKRSEQLKQIREMSVEELKEQADTLKESLFRLKFRKSLGVGEVVAGPAGAAISTILGGLLLRVNLCKQ